MSFIKTSDNDSVLESLRDYLHEQYGLYYSDDRLYKLERVTDRRIRRLPIEGLVEYGEYLQENENEQEKLLEEVSTNKTYFFREPVHFDFLRDTFLPRAETNQRPIKVWSAACSTGPEPYSASMLLHDHGRDYSIMATDLSQEALRTAQEAVYPERQYERVRSYNADYTKYLESVGEEQYRVENTITDSVQLRWFNLKSTPFPLKDESVDCVFCRNVMIYFNVPMIESMVHQFTRILRPGRLLLIGRTETLSNIDSALDRVQSSIYQKP